MTRPPRAHPAKTAPLRRGLLIAAGALGVADTFAVSMISNMNLGVIMPLILGAPLLLYGLFYRRLRGLTQKGWGRVLRIVFCAGYAAFLLLFFVCCALMISGERTQARADADAVIVLGAGLREDVVTLSLKSRLDTALAYLRKNKGCVAVVSGGQGPQEAIPEAVAMSQYLIANGVAAERILLEDKATSTWENFAYSKRLLDERLGRPYRVVFVTNGFHVYRAALTAAAAGLSAQGLPSPSAWYLYPNNYLRETAALFKTWMFGIEGRTPGQP